MQTAPEVQKRSETDTAVRFILGFPVIDNDARLAKNRKFIVQPEVPLHSHWKEYVVGWAQRGARDTCADTCTIGTRYPQCARTNANVISRVMKPVESEADTHRVVDSLNETILHDRDCHAQSCPKPGSACCLLYTSPSPRDGLLSRMPSSA